MVFRRRRRRKSFIHRVFRAGFIVVVLTAFVVGISYFTRGIVSADTDELVGIASPILKKLGLSEEKTGKVAGEFVERVGQTGINRDSGKSVLLTDTGSSSISRKAEENESEVAFTVALFADSESDNEMFDKAIELAKDKDVDYVFHLGDLTEWGTKESLQVVEDKLNDSGLNWHVLPGDLDLGQSLGADNFLAIFDSNYYTIEDSGVRLLFLDNSTNFSPISDESMSWFLSQIDEADFVFLSQPLYHPTNSKYMGNHEDNEDQDLKDQASVLLTAIRNSDVKGVFAADHHYISNNKDPERGDLMHHVVGAITSKRNIQNPSIEILTVYENLKYDIEEVEL